MEAPAILYIWHLIYYIILLAYQRTCKIMEAFLPFKSPKKKKEKKWLIIEPTPEKHLFNLAIWKRRWRQIKSYPFKWMDHKKFFLDFRGTKSQCSFTLGYFSKCGVAMPSFIDLPLLRFQNVTSKMSARTRFTVSICTDAVFDFLYE